MATKKTHKPIPESQWEWNGYASHFICAERCLFRMSTVVGDFIISSVGDYRQGGSDTPMKPIGAGENAFFETYVFARGKRCACGCGEYRIADGCELDGVRTAKADACRKTHMEYCRRYAAMSAAAARRIIRGGGK